MHRLGGLHCRSLYIIRCSGFGADCQQHFHYNCASSFLEQTKNRAKSYYCEKLYFDQRNFSNRSILEGLMDGLFAHTQGIPPSLDFAQSLPMRHVVDILGDRLLVCMKVLLLGRPLIVLARSATTSSSFSVAIASLFPMTISSLADGSLAVEASSIFDRKASSLIA